MQLSDYTPQPKRQTQSAAPDLENQNREETKCFSPRLSGLLYFDNISVYRASSSSSSASATVAALDRSLLPALPPPFTSTSSARSSDAGPTFLSSAAATPATPFTPVAAAAASPLLPLVVPAPASPCGPVGVGSSWYPKTGPAARSEPKSCARTPQFGARGMGAVTGGWCLRTPAVSAAEVAVAP